MQKLKIAYISSSDPRDKHAWSGTAHYIYKALEKKGCEVDLLGPAEPKFILLLCKIFQAFSIYVCRKRFDFRHAKIVSKAYARIFCKKLQTKQYDLIIAPGGVSYTAYLKTNIPIVLVLDRSLGNAFDYHSVLSNLWGFSKKQSLTTDKMAMQKARLILFSSSWAADYAIENYKIEKNKVMVVPFGANLDIAPTKDFVISQAEIKKCSLLLIGTYWKNKGADIAVKVLNKLNERGIDANLTIIGCTPPVEIKNKNLKIIPFINKNTEEGKKQMEAEFLKHNIFILPTRFEAFGIVFCEASAYGLISFGNKTGGVPSVINEGVNGYLMEMDETGENYANAIEKLYNNPTKMAELKITARNYFDEKLNWEAWASTLLEASLIKNLKTN